VHSRDSPICRALAPCCTGSRLRGIPASGPMLRASLIAALTLAAIAASSSARADELCLSMPELTVRTVRIAHSIAVGPFFSSAGSTLIAQGELADLLARAELERREGTPLSEILWCWSGNDPRCAPSAPSPDDGPRGVQSARNVVAALDGLAASR